MVAIRAYHICNGRYHKQATGIFQRRTLFQNALKAANFLKYYAY